MKTRYPFLLLLALLSFGPCLQSLKAQVGIGTSTPDVNAMLDVTSTTKGILLPRLTTAQQNTLASTLNNGQRGMMVIDANTGKPIIWTGGAWNDVSGVTVTASLPLLISSINTISINPGTASGDLISWDGTNWVNKQPAVQHFNINADNRQPFLAVNYCIGTQGIFPSRSAAEPFVGEIDLFSFQFAPKGFAQCNGQLMSISQNTALFSLLGTQYGGNGTTNFALPDLRGRVSIHTGSNGISSYSIGQTGGAETNTITH
jgi:microcystin-dependent protein